MEKFWILLLSLLAIFTFVLYKISIKRYRNENSDKMWKQYGMRTRYWQLVVLVSFGVTCFTMLVLKWTNLVTL